MYKKKHFDTVLPHSTAVHPTVRGVCSLVVSKLCNQSGVQPWSARNATSEAGTSGFRMEPGCALQVVDPKALTETPSDTGGSLVEIGTVQFMEAPETSQQCNHLKAPRWGPKSPLRYTALRRNTQRRHSTSSTERTLYCTKARPSHRLAVIFGQRVVDKVRATITVDTQQTPHGRQETAATRHRPY